MYQSYALMQGGRIYTLQKLTAEGQRDNSPFRWIGYCDGQRCGLFKTKADFERFVQAEPAVFAPTHAQAAAAFRAETWGHYDGAKVLQWLHDHHGKRS